MLHLEGTKNRISIARDTYNDTCKKLNRSDLQFSPGTPGNSQRRKEANVKELPGLMGT